jgi:Transglutaminase elicitor
MLNIFILIASFSAFAFSPNSINEEWKGFSEPEIMASGFTHQFDSLPLEGSVQIGPRAWSGHYWPSAQGGINVRWNTREQEGFKYKSPKKEEVLRMSQAQLAQLSPSEKYDLLTGKYDYPLKELAESAASRTAPDWAGICHGWAPATLFHNEPTPKTAINPDGVVIPFGSSDIKALLSYYYAFHHETESTHQVGLRCFFGPWMGGAKGCDEDLNAGAFHIVISNMLGLRREGFMADVDRFKQVWNQPIVGYRSQILGANLPKSKKAAEAAVREVRIATDFFYVDEVNEPTWDIVHGTKDQKISKRSYLYRVELDRRGQIVGGEWESDERPDFLWNSSRATKFEGILYRLSELLND